MVVKDLPRGGVLGEYITVVDHFSPQGNVIGPISSATFPVISYEQQQLLKENRLCTILTYMSGICSKFIFHI